MKLTKLNELIEDAKALKGRWQLGRNHEVQFLSLGKDEEVKVRGSLLAAEPEALVFSVTESQEDQTIVSSVWKLAGKWRANPKNQLAFEAEKKDGRNDVLTFAGGWRVGEFQELLYTYEVRDLKTKRKELRLLVFQGAWDITEKNRLVFAVGGDPDSQFRFRASLQTRSILAKKGEIRYQLGMEVLGKRQTQNISLFGKWKYSDKLGLSFEMEYEEGQRRSITFGGNYSFTDADTVAVQLKSSDGSSLDGELLLTRDLFGKDGQAFLKLKKSTEGSRIEAGLRLKF